MKKNNRARKSIVGIEKITVSHDRKEIANSLFGILDSMKNRGALQIPQNAKVMIKLNICYLKGFETGATVDHFIVKCLVDWLLRNYEISSINIGEADATKLDVETAFRVLGWCETFKSYSRVTLLNLTKNDHVEVPIVNGLFLND